ncbi:Hypothetical protein CINCED_3A001229, partial [Cinara cedri]
CGKEICCLKEIQVIDIYSKIYIKFSSFQSFINNLVSTIGRRRFRLERRRRTTFTKFTIWSCWLSVTAN